MSLNLTVWLCELQTTANSLEPLNQLPKLVYQWPQQKSSSAPSIAVFDAVTPHFLPETQFVIKIILDTTHRPPPLWPHPLAMAIGKSMVAALGREASGEKSNILIFLLTEQNKPNQPPNTDPLILEKQLEAIDKLCNSIFGQNVWDQQLLDSNCDEVASEITEVLDNMFKPSFYSLPLKHPFGHKFEPIAMTMLLEIETRPQLSSSILTSRPYTASKISSILLFAPQILVTQLTKQETDHYILVWQSRKNSKSSLRQTSDHICVRINLHEPENRVVLAHEIGRLTLLCVIDCLPDQDLPLTSHCPLILKSLREFWHKHGSSLESLPYISTVDYPRSVESKKNSLYIKKKTKHYGWLNLITPSARIDTTSSDQLKWQFPAPEKTFFPLRLENHSTTRYGSLSKSSESNTCRHRYIDLLQTYSLQRMSFHEPGLWTHVLSSEITSYSLSSPNIAIFEHLDTCPQDPLELFSKLSLLE